LRVEDNQIKNARGSINTDVQLESHATAVSRQFALHLVAVKDRQQLRAQLEEFTQYFAYYALMVRPEGRISAVSHFFPVTVN
jgi:hypothetical protein